MLKSVKDASKSITKDLNKSGILIKERTVQLVIENYLDYKRNEFMQGNSIEEAGIGTTRPTFRRSNTFDSHIIPTAKLALRCDGGLKEDMLKSLATNKDVCTKLAPFIKEDELEYIRSKYDLL